MELEIEYKAFETDLRLGLFPSRKLILERNKALTHARNPSSSKYGQCLVSVNTRLNGLLKRHIDQLNAELKRMQLQESQKKKYFVKSCKLLNHEPLLLVRRPKSDPTVDLKTTKKHTTPRFMRPTLAKVIRPSSLSTIDLFTVQPVKKKNMWEKAGEETPLRFVSIVRPCAKLSDAELIDLKQGYSAIKPSVSMDDSTDGLWTVKSNISSSEMEKSRKASITDSENEENEKLSDTMKEVVCANVDTDFENNVIDTKDEKQKTFQTENLSADYHRSPSFITEIGAADKSITVVNQYTNDDVAGITKTNGTSEEKKMSSTVVESEYVSKAKFSTDVVILKTDTTQIPFKFPSSNTKIHETIKKVPEEKNELPEENSKNTDEKRFTLRNQRGYNYQRSNESGVQLSKLNVLKRSILQNAAKARPHSFPIRKSEIKPKRAIIKVKDPSVKRTPTPKTVKFMNI